LLQPPPSIEAITEPEALRHQLDELWTAANCLQIALDKWATWFVELREKGDAHPAVALNCGEMACTGIKVLLAHRPNIAPFNRLDETALVAMLPPIPAWWIGAAQGREEEDRGGTDCDKTTRWQEDREFLYRYYWPPERLREKAGKLRAAAAQLVELLKSFPMAVMTPLQGASRVNQQGQPSGSRRTMKQPSKDAIAAYRLQLLKGKTQKALAEQLTEELRRPVNQGTVSRWLKQVKAWLEAGNVLPDLTTTTRTRKPRPLDPEKIDLGERQDGRANHQRERRSSDED